MIHIFQQLKTKHNLKPYFLLKLYSTEIKNTCNKEPEVVKEPKIIQEKSCKKCCFETWKPKTTEMLLKDLKEMQKVEKSTKCIAGAEKKSPPPKCKNHKFDPVREKNSCLQNKKTVEVRTNSTNEKLLNI